MRPLDRLRAGLPPHAGVRLRLTALYAVLVAATTIVLLGISWWLLKGHLERTLPPSSARDISDRLLGQYAVALAGVLLIGAATGWALAGRALAPLEAALGRLRSLVAGQRRFIANASHELRSPLTMIRTEAEVTLDDPDASVDELREMGRVVLEASDRTEALLDGLLVLALSQRDLARREPVDLAQLAARVGRGLRPEASEAGVRLTVDASRAVVRGDEQLLERLIANLAENAIRHNERGGWATVAASTQGNHAVVRVANGGDFVPDDAVARLAEPFERLDRAAPRRGSGLGLSIVRSVAEAHGGTLTLRGRREGGLEVEVTLPGGAAYPDLTAGTVPSSSCTTPTTSTT